MKLKRIMALGMVMTVFATGCQKAPEDAAVKEKNLDKMIEQAKDTKEAGEALGNMAEKYTSYKNSFANKKLGVKVNVDAKVEIPKTNQMSIVRVERKKIEQQFLDKVKNKLNLNQKFYDVQGVAGVRTKSIVEGDIRYNKQILTNMKNNKDYLSAEPKYREAEEKAYKEEVKELEEQLEQLDKEYKEAPASIDWMKYLSDGKMKPDKDGDEIYYGLTHEKENNMTLFVRNSEELGSCFRFCSNKNFSEIENTKPISGATEVWNTSCGRWPAGEKPGARDTIWRTEVDPDKIYEYKNESNTISEKQARETAEKFLKDIGLTDFQYSDGGLYCETFGKIEDHKIGYRKIWYLKYLRNLNGVLVNTKNGYKEQEQTPAASDGDNYVRKMWPGESIEFCINDSGIVTYDYEAPIQIKDTVVKNAKLKKIDEIKKIFEKMVITDNAQLQEGEEKDEVTLKIDKVVLSYRRISEKDNFDTGLLVPVWDFFGTKKYKNHLRYEDSLDDECILTVNAIDGTVINGEIGY